MIPIIRAENLGKQYCIGEREAGYATLRETLGGAVKSTFKRFRSNGRLANQTIWALKDVSFEVMPGEVVGVIGRNGAGKSTLLKILSRITEPTEGGVDLHGRVGSLLEVGTGFHPELTGRENVYLNGAILGMKRAEITSKFDQIIAFAEIKKFVDMPVKRYSSGMYMRLAFAVAAFLEPEILVVDEVLAVGDMQFQKKCLGKIGEVSRAGRTVVFVSHDLRALKNLCSSGIYLQDGKIVAKKSIREAISLYSSEWESANPHLPYTGKDLVVYHFDISQGSVNTSNVDGSLPFTICTEFELLRDMTQFRLGIYLQTPLGDTITRSFLADWDAERETLKAGYYQATLEVPAKLLSPGTYRVLLHSSRYGIEDYLRKADIRREISVAAPARFNEAHLGENFDSIFILENGWNLSKKSA